MCVIFWTWSVPTRPRWRGIRFWPPRSATLSGKQMHLHVCDSLIYNLIILGPRLRPGVRRACIGRCLPCSTQTRKMLRLSCPRIPLWESERDTKRRRPAWAWRRCASGSGRPFRIRHVTIRRFFTTGNESPTIPPTIRSPSSTSNWRCPRTRWRSTMPT